jgi:pimeloyl-[acyl-carrier protein] methyl ester esterase
VPAGVGKDCQQYWPNLQPVYIERAAHVPFLSHPDIFMHYLQGFLNVTP